MVTFNQFTEPAKDVVTNITEQKGNELIEGANPIFSTLAGLVNLKPGSIEAALNKGMAAATKNVLSVFFPTPTNTGAEKKATIKGDFLILGKTPFDLGLAHEYGVSIKVRYDKSDKSDRIVWAVLQKPFSISASSDWSSIENVTGGISDLLKIGGAAVGVALQSRALASRYWNSTSPLTLTLDLRLEAVDDEMKDVIIPAITLQSLALPRLPLGSSPFLQPPGPNWTGPVSEVAENLLKKLEIDISGIVKGGVLIDVNIGTRIKFIRVIVDSVDVTFSNKMGLSGYPTSADISFKFSTASIVPAEEYNGYFSLPTEE